MLHLTIANYAIVRAEFAIAGCVPAGHMAPAFQASSPNIFTGRFHLKPAFFYLSEASVKPKPPIWSFLVKFTTRNSTWRAYRSKRRSYGGTLSHHHSRSEAHTSELKSLMSKSYAVFCLQKKKNKETHK